MEEAGWWIDNKWRDGAASERTSLLHLVMGPVEYPHRKERKGE